MSSDKIWSIVKGAAIAAAGAVLTYVTAAITGADFGNFTPAVVAVWSIVVQVVRKYLQAENAS